VADAVHPAMHDVQRAGSLSVSDLGVRHARSQEPAPRHDPVGGAGEYGKLGIGMRHHST